MEYIDLVALLDVKGLTLDQLDILKPNADLAKISMLQCEGDIIASNTGVSAQQTKGFIDKTKAYINYIFGKQPSLALTPEYSMPWENINFLLENSLTPQTGAVWVFGCESISPADLKAFMEKWEDIIWITELEELDEDGRSFLDPLIIVANVIEADISKLCICVQFKCIPMAGDTSIRIETDNLICGEKRYYIRNANTITLLPLICSDVFNFDHTKLPEYLQFSYFICHIQMTPKPFYKDFCNYRNTLFSTSLGTRYEFLTLNWAAGTTLNGIVMSSEYGGSGYYIKPEKYNIQEREVNWHKEPHQADAKINLNHLSGLYLKFNEHSRSAAYYFSACERLFFIEVSKVLQDLGIPAQKHRSGATSIETLTWSDDKCSWDENGNELDGITSFSDSIAITPPDLLEIEPVNRERLISLSVGDISENRQWFFPRYLHGLQVSANDEQPTGTMVKMREIQEDEISLTLTKLSILTEQILKTLDSFNIPYLELKKNDLTVGFSEPNSFNSNIKDGDKNANIVIAYIGENMERIAKRRFDRILKYNSPDRLLMFYRQEGLKFIQMDIREIDESGIAPDDIMRE